MTQSTSIPPLGGPSPAEDTFTVYSHKGNVRFLSRAVQPPSAVYVDVDDVLQVGCASSQTGEVVTVSYRLLRADGELIKGQFQLFPQNTRAVVTKQEPLAEGFLLSVSCRAAVATTRGQTFVRVFLTDPALGGGQPSYMLMADYVTTAMAPAHPNGRVLAPTEGPGWPHNFNPATPGVGLNWSAQVPANARWAIKSCFFNFNTDGTAGNRDVGILILSGGTIVWEGFAIQTVGPTAATQYGAGRLTPWTTANPDAIQLALPPDVALLSFGQIGSVFTNNGPGDQFSGIGIQVEEWLDNV